MDETFSKYITTNFLSRFLSIRPTIPLHEALFQEYKQQSVSQRSSVNNPFLYDILYRCNFDLTHKKEHTKAFYLHHGRDSLEVSFHSSLTASLFGVCIPQRHDHIFLIFLKGCNQNIFKLGELLRLKLLR